MPTPLLADPCPCSPACHQVAGDFDPEEYDKQMAAAFGDDYYDAVRPGQRSAAQHSTEAAAACAQACLLAPTKPGQLPGGGGQMLDRCPAVRAVQDADLDEDDLADEQFEKELEAMAQYGSDDEDPRSFAALHRRLAAQRKADAGAGGARALPWRAISSGQRGSGCGLLHRMQEAPALALER